MRCAGRIAPGSRGPGVQSAHGRTAARRARLRSGARRRDRHARGGTPRPICSGSPRSPATPRCRARPPTRSIVRDLLGIDVPVHAGADRPLVAEPVHADYVHGESGMDGADLPEPSGPPASADAVGFIIETCRADEGTWLVATGPLTNIALGAARRARSRRPHRRHLADGWRLVRQPHACRRVQHLVRPARRRDRVPLGRAAGDDRPRRDPPVPGDTRARRADPCGRQPVRRRSSPTCSSSSAAPTRPGTTGSRCARARSVRGAGADPPAARHHRAAPRRRRDVRRAHPRA